MNNLVIIAAPAPVANINTATASEVFLQEKFVSILGKRKKAGATGITHTQLAVAQQELVKVSRFFIQLYNQ